MEIEMDATEIEGKFSIKVNAKRFCESLYHVDSIDGDLIYGTLDEEYANAMYDAAFPLFLDDFIVRVKEDRMDEEGNDFEDPSINYDTGAMSVHKSLQIGVNMGTWLFSMTSESELFPYAPDTRIRISTEDSARLYYSIAKVSAECSKNLMKARTVPHSAFLHNGQEHYILSTSHIPICTYANVVDDSSFIRVLDFTRSGYRRYPYLTNLINGTDYCDDDFKYSGNVDDSDYEMEEDEDSDEDEDEDEKLEPVWVSHSIIHPQKLCWRRLLDAINKGLCDLQLDFLKGDYTTGDGFTVRYNPGTLNDFQNWFKFD